MSVQWLWKMQRKLARGSGSFDLKNYRFWMPEFSKARVSKVLEVSQAEDIRRVDTSVGECNDIKV